MAFSLIESNYLWMFFDKIVLYLTVFYFLSSSENDH